MAFAPCNLQDHSPQLKPNRHRGSQSVVIVESLDKEVMRSKTTVSDGSSSVHKNDVEGETKWRKG